MQQEVTNQEILNAVLSLGESIQGLATHMDERFSGVEQRFSEVEQRFSGVDGQLKDIKTNMVTKTYLDEKLSDLHSNLLIVTRRGNTKLVTLIEDLEHRKILDHETARRILALEPFPEMSS